MVYLENFALFYTMEDKAEQYFPTYKFQKESRDALLIEFAEAQQIANSQTKIYGQVANILLAITTLSIPYFFNQSAETNSSAIGFLQKHGIIFSLFLTLFGAILLRYFVDLQKQITINARKVVTLRTLLGIDYGHIHLTLPDWRVEGASNPFAIKYFNGWFRFESLPFWILLIGLNFIWYLICHDRTIFLFPFLSIKFPWLLGGGITLILYYFTFRDNLNDRHETFYFRLVSFFSKHILRLPLVDNTEYIIYRAKLSYLEIDRLKINYEAVKKILVEIEDNTFYKNNGISTKSIGRAFLSQFKFVRKRKNWAESGASTLTMQLARSLFITRSKYKLPRKLLEILLSFWITKTFSKEEIIKMYIGAVRFDKGVFGLSAAKRHFFYFNLELKEFSNEQAFFLVERLSNVSATYNKTRIEALLKRVSLEIDKEELFKLYSIQQLAGKIKEI